MLQVQNSVFKGEISELDLIKLRDELEQIIESSDSVIMYKLRKKNAGNDKKAKQVYLSRSTPCFLIRQLTNF